MAQRPHDPPSAVSQEHSAGGQDVTTTTGTTTTTRAGAPVAAAPGAAAAEVTAGTVLAGYLHAQAAEFLRSLRLHRESGSDAEDATEASRLLRRSARRIAGTLHVYRPLTDVNWTDPLRAELLWLSDTLGREHAHAARLARLRGALHRLSGAEGPMGQTGVSGVRAGGGRGEGPGGPGASGGGVTVGAARAGALLERQLTLARTRAHSAALQALGSSRFHAVADAAAVLASELPLDPAAHDMLAREALPCLAEQAHRRLTDAADALPLSVAGHPYNAEALTHGLAAVPAPDAPPAEGRQDAPWHQVRRLVRLRRYAQEVLDEHVASEAEPTLSVRLLGANQALDRHRDAAEAAAAAATAARTPRIAPATAYALGILHADQRHEVEAARYAFGRVWQRLTAPTP